MNEAHVPFPEISPPRKHPPAPPLPPAEIPDDELPGNGNQPIIPYDRPLPPREEPGEYVH